MQVPSGINARRSFGPAVVPADHDFMLGANRDNSEDARFIGFVARERLIGRAERVAVSANIPGHWLPRLERTAGKLHRGCTSAWVFRRGDDRASFHWSWGCSCRDPSFPFWLLRSLARPCCRAHSPQGHSPRPMPRKV
ncbi:MAG: S26 family signal peptidase [Rubrivivax sp.]